MFRYSGIVVYAWVDPGFVCFSAAKSGIKNKDDMRRKVPSFAPAREIRVSRTGGVPPLARMTCSLVKYLDRGLKQWLSLVIPYVLIYLHSLFSSGGFEDINIMKSLFCAEGMIYPSSSHLDIVMSINTISLPVRTGGLDRNPGWLPEFSRVVGFHFI
jgi:hypothetical protein